MIVAAQRIGESLWDGGALALLPEADDDELVAIGTADEHKAAITQIADEERPARARFDLAGRVGTADACGDFDALVEAPADTLPVALCGVIGDGYQQAIASVFGSGSAGGRKSSAARCISGRPWR